MTVKDLKKEVLIKAGVKTPDQFWRLSAQHAKFWQKLNKLGLKNLKTLQDRMNVPADVDATVELDDQEYNRLLSEFERIHFK
jgi:hypothetical protein